MGTRPSGALRSPPVVRVALGILVAACVVYLAHVTVGLGSPESPVYDHWLYDAVIGGSALVCFARAALRKAQLDVAWVPG